MVAQIDDVTEAMKDVVDPELGINVVDLGLIYDIMIDESNIAILNIVPKFSYFIFETLIN